jgi:hypothetical protein
MEETIDIKQTASKRTNIFTWKKLYMYKYNKARTTLNEKYTNHKKVLFEITLNKR